MLITNRFKYNYVSPESIKIKGNKMSVLNLFKGIEQVDESIKAKELETSSGSSFVNKCGVYKGTIERCFATPTKKGGVCVSLHISGETSFNVDLYPVIINKDGKKVTTFESKGKTQSLEDYKKLKQLVYVATGKGQELEEIAMKEEDITYKSFGKDVTVTAATLTDLVGKDIMFGVRLHEQYNYEDGEVDKTSLRTDNNGNVSYSKTLFSVYSKEGKTAVEIVKKEEATQIEKDKEFLASDKAIQRVKLEIQEIEDIPFVADLDDEIQF